MAYASESRTAGLSIGQYFRDTFANLADRRARYSVYRTTLSELNGLTDRDLTDLGIARSQINEISLRAAYGK